MPQVRTAVHKATAPRAYAAPKTRVRPAAATPCPEATPVMIGSPLAMITPQVKQIVLPGLPGTNGRPPNVPIDVGPNKGGDHGTPAVPETTTWVQMIVGFGLVGGAVRMATKSSGVELA